VVSEIGPNEVNLARKVISGSLSDLLSPEEIEGVLNQLISEKAGEIQPQVLRCQIDGTPLDLVNRDLKSRGLLPATVSQLFSVFCRGQVSGLAGTRVYSLNEPLVIGGQRYYLVAEFPQSGSTSRQSHPKPLLVLAEVETTIARGWFKADRFMAVYASAEHRARSLA
jgi:hypothetical protein